MDQSQPSCEAPLDWPFGQKDERPRLLILADDIYLDDAEALSVAAGLRLLGRVPLNQACTRLDAQVDCDIVLLFCPAPDDRLERLLVQI